MIRSRLAAAAAGLLAAGMVMLAAGPAMADTGMSTTTSTSLALCAKAMTGPLYSANCAPGVGATVSAGVTAVTLTLPGVGTLSFTVKADGTIDTTSTPPKPTAEASSNFTAGTPKVSSDGTHISVTFFNAATPTQTYTIKAKVSPPTSVGGAATVVAVAKPAGHQDDQNEAKESETESDDDAQSTSSTTLNLTSTGHDDNESSTGAQHEHQSGSQGSSKGGSHGDGGGD